MTANRSSQQTTTYPTMHKPLVVVNGVLGALLVGFGALIVATLAGAVLPFPGVGILCGFVAFLVMCTGFYINSPNQAVVATFFGTYVGTADKEGFYLTVPLSVRHRVSLKAVNIHTETIKVNDAKGNPIEISAVVVWRVVDPSQAIFGVDDYHHFVKTQCDTAVRSIASKHPYDAPEGQVSLRSCTDDIVDELRSSLQERLYIAGVNIMEARISHLAYAAEIAQTMLRRQQAEATIAARQYIVENAVVIVENVLGHLESKRGMVLENKDKLTLINNLLVTLVSDSESQPVLNLTARG